MNPLIPTTPETSSDTSSIHIESASSESSSHNGRRWENLTNEIRNHGQSNSQATRDFSKNYLYLKISQFILIFSIGFVLLSIISDINTPNYEYELSHIDSALHSLGYRIDNLASATGNQLENLVQVLTDIATILNRTQCQ